MSNKTLSPVAITLIKARDLISDPKHWCPEGLGLNGEDYDAETGITRRCVIRAVAYVSGVENLDDYYNSRRDLHDSTLRILSEHATDRGHSLITENARGHEAVMTMFNKAISSEIERANVV